MIDFFDDLEIDAKRILRNLAWFFGSMAVTVGAGYLAALWGWI